MESQDIFDKIMGLPGINAFKPFYKNHKEALLYLFFGGLAFFLNLFLFILFTSLMGINELIANVISWVICVLFQFFTNRIWVFDGYVETRKEFVQQVSSFFGGRIFTLVVEEVILAIFITWLAFNSVIVKLIAQVIVIILNYIISKFYVFKK